MTAGGRRALTLMGLGAVLAAIIAIVVVVILIASLLRPGVGPSPVGPTPGRPTAQPADCPDVQVISVPGTWESSANDDPIHPHANPRALLLQVTGPLQRAYPTSRAAVYTVPYVAQFHNPIAIPPDGQETYAASRAQGTGRAVAEITRVHAHCPLTGFVLMGFSQGATIAGNIASDIGNGRGPIPAADVLGVGLISDSRRVRGEATAIGPDPDGQGVEVLFGGLDLMGVDLQGRRPGGFGTVAGRTVTICGARDPICNEPDHPLNPLDIIGNVTQLATVLTANSHALYGTTSDWQLRGQTAPRWLLAWARGLIAAAPTPPHT
ncbi:cutinase family protein [Tsukamurella soli]|uniref:Phospholipase n=1 Tax=Tsukamurella soli TaxID=644556 RepID=A0ABP8J6Z6_9ACTN